jgi:hypothetical protein
MYFSSMIQLKTILLLSFFILPFLGQGQEIASIYTLPIFEIVKTDTAIIGVREFDDIAEVSQAPNLTQGVYLNNPFQRKKRIEKISLHLKSTKGTEGLEVKVYEVIYDTIPVKVLYQEYLHLTGKDDFWIELDSIAVEMPKKGVMISYTFIPDKRKTWLRDKYGALSGKLYSKEHLINYIMIPNGVWHKYPDVTLKNSPGFEDLYWKSAHYVPAINLTLVNAD